MIHTGFLPRRSDTEATTDLRAVVRRHIEDVQNVHDYAPELGVLGCLCRWVGADLGPHPSVDDSLLEVVCRVNASLRRTSINNALSMLHYVAAAEEAKSEEVWSRLGNVLAWPVPYQYHTEEGA